jgi:hypothetical protein
MMAGHCFGSSSATLQPFITSDVANYDLFAACGSPAGVVNVVLTINSGVVVYSNSTALAALYQSAPFAAGSTVKVINNGTICGAGGNGGAGQNGPFAEPGGTPGFSGFDAGDAIALQNDWTIDNTNGFIFGGGGGGCGGYSALSSGNGDPGAGGGGGQGRVGGNGGPGGAPGSGNSTGGVQGAAGNFSSPGAGGPSNQYGGVGGDGGAWGTKGATTFAGTYTPPTPGKAGNAIRRNGHVPTFLGGNDSTHVKGKIS